LAQLSVLLLGPPRIERDGNAIEVDTRKAIALLAYLVISGQTHQREALSTLLWPESDESHGRAALRRTLSVLNKALDGPFLDANRDQIGLLPTADLCVDVNEFRQLAGGCSDHDGIPQDYCNACIQALSHAADLARGDFMEGFSLRDSALFDDWQFYQSDTMRRELSAVLKMLSTAQASQGQFEHAIATAHRWLALDPLLEEAHRLLIQLYAWSGQRNAALRQYRECVRILEQELGVPPLEETTHLYQMVLEEGELPLPTRAQIPHLQDPQPEVQQVIVDPLKTGTKVYYPLVGRSVESNALLRLYQGIQSDGRLCILEGENGIGKTRLAQEFIAYAEAKGAICLSARCFAGESELAYGSLIEGLRTAIRSDDETRLAQVAPHWLAEASRLLPELNTMFPQLPQPPSLDDPGAQSRFFEGLFQLLKALCKGPHVGILFFDDLQWADNATLDLLTYLARRLTGRPIFVLLTWRSEPTFVRAQLEILARQAHQDGKLLNLGRLTQSQVADLVRQLTERNIALPENLDQRLYQEAEGLPLFVVEYLTALVESQQFGSDWPIPPNVRQTLHTRIANVSGPDHQVLTTAAVIGRSFDFDILREASARSDSEVVSALESLLARGLVIEEPSRDSGELRYDFSHNKLRDVVYEETSQARRRLLHHRVAETLVNQTRSQNTRRQQVSQIAYHYRLGGRDDLAAEYFRQAGDYAASVYANSEALEHYQLALALAHPQAVEIHSHVGDLYLLQGDYVTAAQSYQAAAALASADELSALEAKLADVHHRRGDWKLAEAHLQSAAETLNESNFPDKLAALYAAWSDIAFHQNQVERANELALCSLDLAEKAAEPHALAKAHNMLGILAREQADYEIAIGHLQHSLEIARSLGEGSSLVAALNNLALVYGDASDYTQAIGLTQQALELCTLQGDRHRAAALHNNLADLYHAIGDTLQSMHHLKEAVQIFADIRVGDEELQPTVWKLVEW
jgi:predicted ATPase/DNA-binding SARP family transcriptional activator